MSATLTACPSCGAAVPDGRLSCASCGQLLASVAGGRTRRGDARPGPRTAERMADAPTSAPTAVPTSETGVPAAPGATPRATPPWAAAVVRPQAAPPPPAGAYIPPSAPLEATPDAAAGVATAPVDRPPTPVAGRSWDPGAARAKLLALTHPVEPGSPVQVGPLGAGGSAGARTSDGRRAFGASLFPGVRRALGDAGGPEQPPLRPMTRMETSLGWVAAAGAVFVAVGLVLPWSEYLIGADGPRGYLSTWGLGSPGHVLVMLAAVVILGFEVVPNRVEPWLRSGIAPLVFGGLVLGLAWPYLFGPFGAGVGVTTTVVGALLLVGAGAVTAWDVRHARPAEPV